MSYNRLMSIARFDVYRSIEIGVMYFYIVT